MEIIDVFGRTQNVDESRRKLYRYDARKKIVVYAAPIIDETSAIEFWTDYEEPMKELPPIEERLQTWNNTLLLAYAYAVDFNSGKNDADGEKWAKFVKFVTENESNFFTKAGDFRKKILVNPKEIAEIMRS